MIRISLHKIPANSRIHIRVPAPALALAGDLGSIAQPSNQVVDLGGVAGGSQKTVDLGGLQ